MTFLNQIMLLGLAAAAIPIIIHILNRRRAKRVEWGAMQFLRDSLAARNRRILIEEIILMALRCLLLGVLAFALARPFVRGQGLRAGNAGQAQDIAIVIDGSLSMNLDVDKKSNFQRAVEEARQIVNTARRGDAVSLVLAGPVAQSVVPSPISDKPALLAALDELTPAGGSMSAPDALQAAVRTLAGGGNPGKKIVLLTDQQRLGWNTNLQQPWTFLADSAAALPTKPALIVRKLPTPTQLRNLTLANVTFSRGVIGANWPVQINVTVANNGTGPSGQAYVETSVDGTAIDSRPLETLSPGASGTIVLDHRFATHGPHLVTARVVCEDDLPADDTCTRVVNVVKDLPVLLIEGAAAAKGSANAPMSNSEYIRLALRPPPEPGQKDEYFITPTIVDAAELAKVKDLAQFSAVVLCNVTSLPAEQAKALAEYVAAGGGMLVLPGARADKDFYNNWTAQDGRRMTGSRLTQVKLKAGVTSQPGEKLAHIAVETISHPALQLAGRYGLDSAQIRGYWQLAPEQDDENISVGALLDSADPYMVARKYQQGLVLTLSVPFDPEFSDLPSARIAVVPLIHEMVYYLAEPAQHPMNVQPGQKILYDIPGKFGKDQPAEMVSFDGRRAPVRLTEIGNRWQAAYDLTARPGVYRLVLPEAALGDIATRPALQATSAAAGRGVPFVVVGNPEESKFELLSPEDYQAVGRHMEVGQAESVGQVISAIQGQVPGREVWRTLAAIAMALVLAEIVVTRAIAAKRKAHLAKPVEFGDEQVDANAFRKVGTTGVSPVSQSAAKEAQA